jgi:hypothetical protein
MAYVDDSGGTFIGNIGFGGVTPGWVLHAEKSVADKLAFFHNTSTSGYGVKFQNGTDANYAIKVESASNVDNVQIFGTGMAQFGGNPTVLGAWQTYRPTTPYVISSAPEGTATTDAGFVLASNTGNDVYFWNIINAAGNDRGFRLQYNSRPEQGPPNGTYGDPAYCQNFLAFEQDGIVSISYARPLTSTAGSYDSLSGKSLCIAGGGYTTDVGPNAATGEFTDLYSGKKGRGLRIGVTQEGSTAANNGRFAIQISGKTANTDNPISVWVGGALKQVTVGATDSGGSGFRLLRVPN